MVMINGQEYWRPRTRTAIGHTVPLPQPRNSSSKASSATRRYENAVHERAMARRYVQLVTGTLVIWERAPWRVVAVDERPDDLWGAKYEADFAHHLKVCESRGFDKPERRTWRGRPIAVQITPVADPKAEPVHLIAPGSHDWDVLPDHYSVCVACGELAPCSHELAERQADRIAARSEVLMDIPPGHCLGCGEFVTTRQRATRFPGPNLWRLDLPENSAVFHARQECAQAVDRYRRQWESTSQQSTNVQLPLEDG